MRLAILALLLLPAALAVDMQRSTVHRVGPDLFDRVEYTDVFYGEVAEGASEAMSSTDAYDYITRRVPKMEIDFFSIKEENGTVVVKINGTIRDFVTPLENGFKLGGRGFIDGICDSPRAGVIPAIDQAFMTTIYLPENLTVSAVPKNRSENLGYIAYDFRTWYSDRAVYQSLAMKTEEASLTDYCSERATIDAQLKQGIIATPASAGVPDLFLSIILFSLLLFALIYLIKGRAL